MFFEELRKRGVGPEGQLTKLEHLTLVLRWLKSRLIPGENYTAGFEAISHIEDKVRTWKLSLRKEKRKLQANRLDTLSRLPLDLNSVTKIVENKCGEFLIKW